MVAQVKRHRYTSLPCRTYRAPVKSTPVNVNGCTSCVLNRGRGGGSGAGYSFPVILRQVTQWCNIDLTYWRAAGIQYDCRKAVTVMAVPEWQSLTCMSRMTNLDSECLEGSRYGNLVVSLTGALWMRPPQRSNPSVSKNSRS